MFPPGRHRYISKSLNLCQLAAAFWVEGLVWGFPTAYGVILVKYMEDPVLSSAPHASYLLPLIGPLASGIMYCAGQPYMDFWRGK